MKNCYIPEPIDTSDVHLGADVLELAECLAENTHDIYVQGRLAEGWAYGPERNDEKKTNPTLIPYKDLPESEKEYDRRTSIETLKVIRKLGFAITKENDSIKR